MTKPVAGIGRRFIFDIRSFGLLSSFVICPSIFDIPGRQEGMAAPPGGNDE
jgi:hypothetical protein